MTIQFSVYDYPPALGWQTLPFATSASGKLLKPSASNISYRNAYIYYWYTLTDQVNPRPDNNTVMFRINKKIQASNRDKFFGYIPVAGTFIGVGRIISTIGDKHLPIKNKVVHILRGSVEFLGLGFLLIVPDFILSNCRNFHAKLWPATNLNSFDNFK